MKPELQIPLGAQGGKLTLRFSALDHFHPDYLFRQLDLFARLRDIRGRLADPGTFSAAAVELGIQPGPASALTPAPAAPRASAPQPDLAALGSGSVLEQVLEKAEEGAAPRRGRDEWDRFLHDLVAPHLVQGVDPRQSDVVAEVDRAISATMQVVFHHPDYQALESAWRGVFVLVQRLETDSSLKLFLVDVSKDDLAEDLSGEDLAATSAYRLLVEQTLKTPGGEPWAAIAGIYRFGTNLDDLMLLGKAGRLAAAAGAPFLAEAEASLLGCESLARSPHPREWNVRPGTDVEEAWRSLRKRPEAAYLGLALPRFILRLPYGAATDACEEFEFEELSETPRHEDYVWASPAVACAVLLGQEFRRSGSEMRPRGGEIDGLPLHTYREGGEWVAKPCAVVLLTQDAVDHLLVRGLMPLISLRGRDAVRLPRFQSSGDPPRGLAGRWG